MAKRQRKPHVVTLPPGQYVGVIRETWVGGRGPFACAFATLALGVDGGGQTVILTVPACARKTERRRSSRAGRRRGGDTTRGTRGGSTRSSRRG